MSTLRGLVAKADEAYDEHPLLGFVVQYVFAYLVLRVAGMAFDVQAAWWLLAAGVASGSAAGAWLRRRARGAPEPK